MTTLSKQIQIQIQSLSWSESAQFRVLVPISLRSILILSWDLRLGIPKGLFPVGYLFKILKELQCRIRKGSPKIGFLLRINPIPRILIF